MRPGRGRVPERRRRGQGPRKGRAGFRDGHHQDGGDRSDGGRHSREVRHHRRPHQLRGRRAGDSRRREHREHHRGRVGPDRRDQPEGPLPGDQGRPAHHEAEPLRQDRVHLFDGRGLAGGIGAPLPRRQGRGDRSVPQPGLRTGAAQHLRQHHRAWTHRDSFLGRPHAPGPGAGGLLRGGIEARGAAGADGAAQGHRGSMPVPRVRTVGLRDRSDAVRGGGSTHAVAAGDLQHRGLSERAGHPRGGA